jgi:hypothetical protein
VCANKLGLRIVPDEDAVKITEKERAAGIFMANGKSM